MKKIQIFAMMSAQLGINLSRQLTIAKNVRFLCLIAFSVALKYIVPSARLALSLKQETQDANVHQGITIMQEHAQSAILHALLVLEELPMIAYHAPQLILF